MMYEAIKKEFQTESVNREPQTLKEGEVVELRRQAPEEQVDMLVRAFENEQRVKPQNLKTSHQSDIIAKKLNKVKDEIEAIYAAFS